MSICSVSDRNATPRFFELPYRHQHMRQRSYEALELPDHQAIARLEEDQHLRKTGAIVGLPLAEIKNGF